MEHRVFIENWYSNITAHKNWQIETAVWNLAGFLHCLKPADSDLGSFLQIFFMIFLMTPCMKILIFSVKILDFLYEKSQQNSLWF